MPHHEQYPQSSQPEQSGSLEATPHMNEAEELGKLAMVSMYKPDEPLADWESELLARFKAPLPAVNLVKEPTPQPTVVPRLPRPERVRTPVELQNEAEESYAEFDNIKLGVADYEAQLTPEEIIERMEIDHSVKQAPRFAEQVLDTTRTNQITYLGEQVDALTTVTSHSDYDSSRATTTEHEALAATATFLDDADAYGAANGIKNWQRLATSLRENLTFIGQKEYVEATKGIADYWKALLEKNPDLQILAVTGKINTGMVKSDQFLLENILQNFTDEEAEKYKKRLIVDIDDITVRAKEPENIKIVLLDDWTISGSQLKKVAGTIRDRLPQFAECLELQLIAANKRRLTIGLEFLSVLGIPDELAIPVRAYYAAHHAENADGHAAHITGFHSSVDYDFENDINSMLINMHATNDRRSEYSDIPPLPDSLKHMPPLTNIVRPYRTAGYKLTQRDRFATARHEPVATHAEQLVPAGYGYHDYDGDDDYEYFGGEEV